MFSYSQLYLYKHYHYDFQLYRIFMEANLSLYDYRKYQLKLKIYKAWVSALKQSNYHNRTDQGQNLAIYKRKNQEKAQA